jgi:hypothetical protein
VLVAVAAMIAAATGSATRATRHDHLRRRHTDADRDEYGQRQLGRLGCRDDLGWDAPHPDELSFTATDVSANNTVLFSDTQAKGNGNGQHNQTQITCTGTPESATAGEVGIPGVNPADVIVFNFTVTAVLKP